MTAIDTNVLIGLLNADDSLNSIARELLETAFHRGSLCICGAVFGELLATPGHTADFIEEFLDNTEIRVDWTGNEAVWRLAGEAFKKYATRRRRLDGVHPRRILTDFYIGAHAVVRGYDLVTLDAKIYRTSFPALNIISG